MTISIKLNDTDYAISVEGNCYTAIKYGINTAEGKNFGEQTSKDLGYFNKLSNAASRLCREEISQSDDIVDIKEYCARIEALNSQLLEQLNSVELRHQNTTSTS